MEERRKTETRGESKRTRRNIFLLLTNVLTISLQFTRN